MYTCLMTCSERVCRFGYLSAASHNNISPAHLSQDVLIYITSHTPASCRTHISSHYTYTCLTSHTHIPDSHYVYLCHATYNCLIHHTHTHTHMSHTAHTNPTPHTHTYFHRRKKTHVSPRTLVSSHTCFTPQSPIPLRTNLSQSE